MASNARINVLVASGDRETLDSVRTYLTRAGLDTAAASSIRRVRHVIARCNALLLFADDFDLNEVLDLLSELSLPCVVVTSAVDSLCAEALTASQSRVVVVRRPAWSWTLLDALRATFERRYSNRAE